MKHSLKRYDFKNFEVLVIFAIWILLFASPILFSPFEDGIEWEHVFDVWKNHLSLLVVFLLHRFVLMPKLFFKGKKIAYFAITGAMIILGSFAVYSFGTRPDQHPPPPRHEKAERPLKPPPDRPPGPVQKGQGPIPYYVNFLLLSILIVGFDAGLQMSMRWMGLEKEKFKLQKESVENQLAFLKNQISPHFFMNTLNNIHALVDIDSEEAKEAIVKLSNLMRHLLYDSEEGQNSIQKEVDFIRSYVELMRLRFTDKVKIELDIPNEIPDKSIPPLLFTSLLENAFKHGVSYNASSHIKIAMSFDSDRLKFMIENSNHAKNTDEPSGIGIENTRRRLDLLFMNQYDFAVDESQEKYAVNLNIPI